MSKMSCGNRLNETDVRDIVADRARGMKVADIARALDVSEVTVVTVLRGRSWQHVTGIPYDPPKRRGGTRMTLDALAALRADLRAGCTAKYAREKYQISSCYLNTLKRHWNKEGDGIVYPRAVRPRGETGRKVAYTEEQVAEARALRASGLSLTDVAIRTGMSVPTVSRQCMGMCRRGVANRTLTASDIEEIAGMCRRGRSYAEISRITGSSAAHVASIAKGWRPKRPKAGLPAKPAGADAGGSGNAASDLGGDL